MSVTVAGFEFVGCKLPVHRTDGLSLSTIMSTPTTSQGVFVSYHLRIIKGILQDAAFGAKCVRSNESDCVDGLKFEIVGSQRSQMKPRRDKRTEQAHVLQLTRVVF